MHLGTGMAANVFQSSSSSAVSVSNGVTQHGLDIFIRVATDGFLWVGDWGHDNGGMFGCGNDNYLGIAPTNIKLATQPPANCLPTAESGTYACISNYDLQTYGTTSSPTYPSCEACTEKGLVYAWTHARTTLWTAAMVQTLYSGVSKTCTLPTGTGPWNQGPSCSSAG